MIFTIQTSDEVSGLDITNLLNLAHIEHTILSKQNDEAAEQSTPHILLTERDFEITCQNCKSTLTRRE